MLATDQLSAEAGLFTYYNHKTSVPCGKVWHRHAFSHARACFSL